MEHNEIAKLGSEYEWHIRAKFEFLQTEYGYDAPMALSASFKHSHCITYLHPEKQKLVELINNFHPVDYGFEINVYRIDPAVKKTEPTMVYSKNVNDQDPDFAYLSSGAQMLRNRRILD